MGKRDILPQQGQDLQDFLQATLWLRHQGSGMNLSHGGGTRELRQFGTHVLQPLHGLSGLKWNSRCPRLRDRRKERLRVVAEQEQAQGRQDDQELEKKNPPNTQVEWR